MTNVFLYGSSGTGKTIVSAEIVKMKLSQLQSEGKSFRVLVNQFTDNESDLLLQNLREKYFINIDCQVLTFKDFCGQLNIECYEAHPKDTINSVINKLRENDDMTILMVDEVWPCDDEGQTTPDWSEVKTNDNVVWIVSLQPANPSDETINLRPPVSDKVLSTKLVRGHRNCLEIRSVVISSFCISYQLQNRQFSTWFISHYHKKRYISLEDDVPVEEDELPQGSTPIWIDVPSKTSHLEILQIMEKMISSRSVTVVYDARYVEEDTGAAKFCQQKNWDYRYGGQMYGCEDEVIIAIDILGPEIITRPHNLLVMVTSPGAE